MNLAEEFKSLLKAAPYMYGYVPEFQNYLENFPSGSSAVLTVGRT